MSSYVQFILLDLDGRMQSLGWKNQQCNNNHMRLSHRAIGFFIFVSGERYDLIDRKAGKQIKQMVPLKCLCYLLKLLQWYRWNSFFVIQGCIQSPHMCNMNVAIFIPLLSKSGFNSTNLLFESQPLLGSYLASTYEPTNLPVYSLLPMYIVLTSTLH